MMPPITPLQRLLCGCGEGCESDWEGGGEGWVDLGGEYERGGVEDREPRLPDDLPPPTLATASSGKA